MGYYKIAISLKWSIYEVEEIILPLYKISNSQGTGTGFFQLSRTMDGEDQVEQVYLGLELVWLTEPSSQALGTAYP